MTFNGNLKRARVAINKRIQCLQKTGNYVFKYEGEHSLPSVQFIQLKDPLGTRFMNWPNNKAVIKSLQDELATSAHCYAVTNTTGLVESYLLVKFGGALEKWFVELTPKDAVIYSVVTHPSVRGKRLAGRLSACVADKYSRATGTVYLDCARWNTSAHQAFFNAGFRKIREQDYPSLQ